MKKDNQEVDSNIVMFYFVAVFFVTILLYSFFQ